MLLRDRSSANRWFLNRAQQQANAHAAFSRVRLDMPKNTTLNPTKTHHEDGSKLLKCGESVCGDESCVAGQ